MFGGVAVDVGICEAFAVPWTALRMDAFVPLCPLYRGAVEERYVILEYLHPGLLPSGHRRAFAQGSGHGRFGSGRPAGAVAFSAPAALLFLAVIVVTGGLAATRAEILLGRTDPGEVVIDELVGVWIALLPLGAGQWSWPGLVWAFALFRLFDIWKPWPVHASENWLPAGWGIMLDDILAGLMAMCCMLVLRALGWV